MKKFIALFLTFLSIFYSSSVLTCFADSKLDSSNPIEVNKSENVKKSRIDFKKIKGKYLTDKNCKIISYTVAGVVYCVVVSYAQFQFIKSAVKSGIDEYNKSHSILEFMKNKFYVIYDYIKYGFDKSIDVLDNAANNIKSVSLSYLG